MEKNEIKKVEKEVKEAFKLLAKAEGIEITEKDLPKVELSSTGTSKYSDISKTISIDNQDIDNGYAYFAEASHALRDFVYSKSVGGKRNEKVDEFFDAVGRQMGKELTKGTELEHLFKVSAFPKAESEEGREYFGGVISKARRAIKYHHQISKSQKEIGSSLLKAVGSYKEALETKIHQYEQGKIKYDQLNTTAKQLADSFNQRLGDPTIQKGLSKSQKGAIEIYKDILDLASSGLEGYKNLPEEKKRKFAKEELRKEIKELTPEESMFYGESEEVHTAEMKAKYLKKEVMHRKPYIYAEQLSSDELLSVKGLYTMSDDEVREKFFHKRKPEKSLLERILDKFFLAIFFIALFYFVVNPKITGFAIIETTKTILNTFGTILLLLFLVTLLIKLMLRNL